MWAVLSRDSDDALKPTFTIPFQDEVKQCATTFGAPIDARIQRGRTKRHVLRHRDGCWEVL